MTTVTSENESGGGRGNDDGGGVGSGDGGTSGKLPNGHACAQDENCASGVCGWDLQCKDALPNGHACAEDEDCASGVCSFFKCKGNENCEDVTVELKADKHGQETSWELSRDGGDGEVVLSSEREAAAHEEVRKTACLPPGDYVLAVLDEGSDGVCCQNGNGHFRAYIGDARVVNGGRFGAGAEYPLRVGYRPPMTARDALWLDAHNRRRREWHGRRDYVPLAWSPSLADEARAWAELLVASCDKDPWHAPNVDEGENIAGNRGTGSWGKQPDPDKVCNRFVERERDLGWPRNSHLTQALWRPTRYVGCGEAGKDLGGGESCHRQVCRYLKPGNCAMGDGSDWMKKMLQDDSRCGDEQCPLEGCYAYSAYSAASAVDGSLQTRLGFFIFAFWSFVFSMRR